MDPIRFQSYVAPARRKPQFWRLSLGVLLGIGLILGWVLAMFGLISWLSDPDTAVNWSVRLARPETPEATLLLLASFGGMALAPMVVVRLLHGRGIRTLFGPAQRVVRDFAAAAAVVALIYGLGTGLWALIFDSVPNLDLRIWLALLPIGLAGIALQTMAEELVFRGYLMQQLAARFRNRAVWFLLPGLIFGLVHFDPVTAGTNAWFMALAATLFGLAAADLTVQTGSLGAAWGFHFGNNLLAIQFLATDGTITGLALRLTPYAANEGGALPILVIGDLAMIGLSWWLLRRVLQR